METEDTGVGVKRRDEGVRDGEDSGTRARLSNSPSTIRYRRKHVFTGEIIGYAMGAGITKNLDGFGIVIAGVFQGNLIDFARVFIQYCL